MRVVNAAVPLLSDRGTEQAIITTGVSPNLYNPKPTITSIQINFYEVCKFIASRNWKSVVYCPQEMFVGEQMTQEARVCMCVCFACLFNL